MTCRSTVEAGNKCTWQAKSGGSNPPLFASACGTPVAIAMAFVSFLCIYLKIKNAILTNYRVWYNIIVSIP